MKDRVEVSYRPHEINGRVVPIVDGPLIVKIVRDLYDRIEELHGLYEESKLLRQPPW